MCNAYQKNLDKVNWYYLVCNGETFRCNTTSSVGFQVFAGSVTISEFEGISLAENSDFKMHNFPYSIVPNPSVPAQIKMLPSDVT